MKLKTKVCIFGVLLFLIIIISSIKSTYSRYASSASGTAETDIANWQIKLDNKDINNAGESYEWENTFSSSALNAGSTNVARGKVAPGTNGVIEVKIDPSKVDVSFKMKIEASVSNTTNGKLILNGGKIYSGINAGTYDSSYESLTMTGGSALITKNYYLNTAGTSGKFKFNTSKNFNYLKLNINYYWDSDGDAADTQIGHNASSSPIDQELTLKITFEQIV